MGVIERYLSETRLKGLTNGVRAKKYSTEKIAHFAQTEFESFAWEN
jgi:hypothetical protein